MGGVVTQDVPAPGFGHPAQAVRILESGTVKIKSV
jgi:hypothetical protein